MRHWMPDPAEWDAVTAAIEQDRDLSGIPYPARALAFSALRALADRERGAVEALRRGKPLQGNAPEPIAPYGWVTVFFRPDDWRTLDALRSVGPMADRLDTIERKWCRDCRDEITGSDDGTGLAYCHDCDEAKDDEHVLVPASQLEGAVSTKITDAELDAAWSAWSERWVTSSGRDAMREALMTFARFRAGGQ